MPLNIIRSLIEKNQYLIIANHKVTVEFVILFKAIKSLIIVKIYKKAPFWCVFVLKVVN